MTIIDDTGVAGGLGKGVRLSSSGLEFVEELGRGAYATVYRALRGDEEYAVKVLNSSKSFMSDEEGLRRLRREAGLLARSEHPGLTEIYEVGRVDGRPYLVMDYVSGMTLRRHLDRQGPMAVEAVLELAAILAGALSVVHRRGIVHCDIKPDNIIFDARARARLVDFGLATTSGTYPRGDFFAGTLRYAAPEQSGSIHCPIDERADLYSLGIVLYECLTGAPPFDSEMPEELARAHVVEEVPSVDEVRADVPKAVVELVARLVEKDPADRFRDAEDLLDELRRIFDEDERFKCDRAVLEVPADEGSAFVGRLGLLASLRHRWMEVHRSGKGVILEIVGEAGIGKRRILQEFSRRLPKTAPVLRGRCRKGPDLSVFRALIADLVKRYPEEEVRELLSGSDFGGLLARAYPALRPLIDAGEEEGDGPTDLLLHATADLIITWARRQGAVVMLVDDFEEADLATRRVFLRLRAELTEIPLLVVLASRERTGLGAVVEVAPMDEEDVGMLLSAHFRGHRFGADFISRLWDQSRGLPVLVEEYVPWLIEEGVVEPHWGDWKVDMEALNALSLPSDMASYVVGKLDGLSPSVSEILETAAVLGRRFDSQTVQAVYDGADEEVATALMDAVEKRLLRHHGGEEYQFVHDEVWTALRGPLDLSAEKGERRRALHQRIAEYLDGEEGEKRASPAALAHHYARGEVEKNPRRVYELNYEVGLRAQRRRADAQALEYFEYASQAVRYADIDPDADFEMAFGQLCARQGRLEEAAGHLRRALSRLDDPFKRCRVRERLSWIYLANFELDLARRELDRAFEELDEPLPDSRIAQVLLTAGDWLSFQWKRLSKRSRKKEANHHRERSRCLSAAYDQAAYLAYVANDDLLMAQAMIRPLRGAEALGTSREAVVAYYNYAIFLAEIGRGQRARRFADRAVEMAVDIGDPRQEARARLHRAWAYHFAGYPRLGAQYARRCLEADGQWLDLFDYLNGCMELAWNLLMRGYCVEALQWLERADRRTEQVDGGGKLIAGHVYALSSASLHTILGDEKKGLRILEQYDRQSQSLPSNWTRRAEFWAHRLLSDLERGGEVEQSMEQARRVYGEFDDRPGRLNLHYQHYYVFRAYGVMRRCEKEHRRHAPVDVKALGEALRELRKQSSHPLIEAHRHVVEAARHRWMGRLDAARDHLRRAEKLASDIDAPWVDFEVAMQMASLARASGVSASATRWARKAYLIAMDGGWRERSERVRQAFPDCATSVAGLRSRGSGLSRRMTTSGYRGHRLHNYLDALFEIARASMSTVDPSMLAERALDIVVDLLGCERALLFVGGERGLEQVAARDADGQTLDRDCGYSHTVIDHVWHTGESVVISGSAEGMAFGSKSIIARDLRSVAAVAISFRDELFGVLYLDSTLARGVFVSDDLDFLRAIATHVAIGVETARSAQMEANLEAERQRRRLAETLQALNQVLSSTLDEEEVLARAVEQLTELIPCDKAAAFRRRRRGWDVVATAGFSEDPAARVQQHYEANLLRLTDHREQAARRDEERSRLVVSFFGHREVIGAMVLERRPPAGFDDRELRLAATVAGQVGMAQENARLYEEVHQLAMIDPLTEVPNRRHFFDVASDVVERAREESIPVAAVMLDIDHFKAFNDTHGHAAADVVLSIVARRCRRVLRDEDLFARYGGEEFVALLPNRTAQVAEKIGGRLRAAVGDEPVEVEGEKLNVTISVGVAHSDEMGSLSELLKEADDALYRAKEEGRNRVRMAVENLS